MRSRHRTFLLAGAALALTAAIAAIYAPLRHADYISLDDHAYVIDNPWVRGGLTWEGLRQAFLGRRAGLWMPLTFASHMLDVELFGLAPRFAHVENVGFHALNAVLLLLFLVRATGRLAPSVVATALFALHPLRVESVAWIAERKDVLSTCFGLLTLHAWVGYARRPGFGRYLVVATLFVLALLAKPMLVTLPILLALIDWWPLRRLGTPGPDGRPVTLARLALEKIPLFALAAATAAITIATARADGGLADLTERPAGARIAHAIVSYVWYAGKTAWPTDLAVFYPYHAWSASQVAFAATVLLAAGAVAFVARRRAPWIAVGLAWFAVGLVPVIGLLQAGSQGMADRFTYLPGIGLAVAVVWTLDATLRSARTLAALTVAVFIATASLGVASARQVAYWRDSETLYQRTLAVTEGNWIMLTNLATVRLVKGHAEEAYGLYARAFELEPRHAKAACGLGNAAQALGRIDEAEARYRATLTIDPMHVKAHNDLGIILFERDEGEEALHHFSEAVRLDPDARDAVPNLRVALAHAGFAPEQVDGYLRGLRLWSEQVSADRERPGGEAYGAKLGQQLLSAHTDSVRHCLGTNGATKVAPFNLYVSIAPDGMVSDVTPVPPTRVARCLGAELRDSRAPVPPFGPFHGQVAMRFAG